MEQGIINVDASLTEIGRSVGGNLDVLSRAV